MRSLSPSSNGPPKLPMRPKLVKKGSSPVPIPTPPMSSDSSSTPSLVPLQKGDREGDAQKESITPSDNISTTPLWQSRESTSSLTTPPLSVSSIDSSSTATIETKNSDIESDPKHPDTILSNILLKDLKNNSAGGTYNTAGTTNKTTNNINNNNNNTDLFFLNKPTSLPTPESNTLHSLNMSNSELSINTKDIMTKSSRNLQPLDLKLPNITPLSNKNQQSFSSKQMNHSNTLTVKNMNPMDQGNDMNNKTNNNRRNNSEDPTNNKFYIQLLEDVHLDDQTVLYGLVDTLMQVRKDNEKLKEDLWNKLETFNISMENRNQGIHQNNTTGDDHNSLLFDSNITNDELLEMLKEQRIYNKILAQTVDDYEESLDKILDQMVKSNKEIGEELLNTIQTGEKDVEEKSDDMWRSWKDVTRAMDDVRKLETSIVGTLHGL